MPVAPVLHEFAKAAAETTKNQGKPRNMVAGCASGFEPPGFGELSLISKGNLVAEEGSIESHNKLILNNFFCADTPKYPQSGTFSTD
jgi:hypothetical protein